MSTRSLRARLDRLERLTRANSVIVQESNNQFKFTIDPTVAKNLRDDYERRMVLWRKRHNPKENGGPPSAAELEEEQMLKARILERARAIGCLPGYGLKEQHADNDRLSDLHYKRLSPPSCGGGTLNINEDAEEAQLRARVEAFNASPEADARKRIDQLRRNRQSGLSTAEQSELDSLILLYSDVDLPPNPFEEHDKRYVEALDAAIKKCEEESKERDRQRIERRARERAVYE